MLETKDFSHLTINKGVDKIPDGRLLSYYNTVALDDRFNSQQDAVSWLIEMDMRRASDSDKSLVQELLGNFIGKDIGGTDASHESAEPDRHYLRNKFPTDTSIGGNDVVNPLWQFCEFDDIIHPPTAIDPSTCKEGLGRCYEEMYDRNMEVLEVQFGVPVFTGVMNYMMATVNGKMHDLTNSGDLDSATFFSKMLSTASGAVWKYGLPVMKSIWGVIRNKMNAGTKHAVSQYVEFEPSMFAYYKQVNSILVTMAVSMQLFDPANQPHEGTPEVLKNGCDIFAILDKRASRLRGGKTFTIDDIEAALRIGDPDVITGDRSKLKVGEWFTKIWNSTVPGMTKSAIQAVAKSAQEAGEAIDDSALGDASEFLTGEKTTPQVAEDGDGVMGLADRSLTRFHHQGLGGMNFVRFRINKIGEVTDTFNNTTGESELGSKLKSMAQEGMQSNFNWGGATGGFTGAMRAMMSTLPRMMDMVKGGLGHGLLAYSVAHGKGMMALPEVWKDSSYSTSRSITIPLRAPYGDPTTIFQTICIPAALWIAGSVPRGVGKNTYKGPFFLRANCRGKFAMPFAIVSSLTLKRGAGEFGWSYQGTPLALDIDVELKDLTPIIFLGIHDQSEAVAAIMRGNDPFQEYLGTFSGLPLWRREMIGEAMFRRGEIIARLAKLKYTGNTYWQAMVGLSPRANQLRRLGVIDRESVIRSMGPQNQQTNQRITR